MELRACVDALKPQLLSTLQQNIQIPSVQGEAEDGAPYGASVRDSLVHVLDTARKLGFRTENMDTLLKAVVKAKPAAAKGQYIRSCTVVSTMGPGVKVSTSKYL